MKKFAASLTGRQNTLARMFEREGITSYSQAVKAFERGNNEQIAEWKRQFEAKQRENNN